MIQRRSTMGEVGRYLVLGGGIVLFISLFLRWNNYYYAGDAFNIFSRDDVYLLILALASVGIAVTDLLVAWGALLPLAVAVGALAFGGPFFNVLEAKFQHVAVGWFIALVGAACVVAGGLLAVLDLIHQSELTPRRATTADSRQGYQAASPGVQPQGQAVAASPPGWYPDPWGQARVRYWSGTSWTGETQA